MPHPILQKYGIGSSTSRHPILDKYNIIKKREEPEEPAATIITRPLTQPAVSQKSPLQPSSKFELGTQKKGRESAEAYQDFTKGLTRPIVHPIKEVKRIAKGFSTGVAGMAKGVGGGLEFISKKYPSLKAPSVTPTSSEPVNVSEVLNSIGASFQKTGKEMEDFYKVKDPKFLDQVYSGVGSLATFIIPGARVSKGVGMVGLSARMAPWLGAGASGLLESFVESGSAYSQAKDKKMGEKEAQGVASKVFWLNLPLVVFTNKFGIFGDKGGAIRKSIINGTNEAVQEWSQQVFSNYALKDPLFQGSLISAGVGLVTGGGVGLAQGISAPKPTHPILKKYNIKPPVETTAAGQQTLIPGAGRSVPKTGLSRPGEQVPPEDLLEGFKPAAPLEPTLFDKPVRAEGVADKDVQEHAKYLRDLDVGIHKLEVESDPLAKVDPILISSMKGDLKGDLEGLLRNLPRSVYKDHFTTNKKIGMSIDIRADQNNTDVKGLLDIFNNYKPIEKPGRLKDYTERAEHELSSEYRESIYGVGTPIDKYGEKLYTLYEKGKKYDIKDRPGSTDLQKEFKFLDEAPEKGFTDLRGQTAKDEKAIASLTKDYRNPKQEYSQFIYTDKNGKILAHTVTTSKHMGQVRYKPKEIFFAVKNRADRLNASKVYMLHNHPGEIMKSSAEDRDLAHIIKNGIDQPRGYSKIPGLGKKFQSSIVTDHDKILVIEPGKAGSSVREEDIDLGKTYKGQDIQIGGSQDATDFIKNHYSPESKKITLFVFDNNLSPKGQKTVRFPKENYKNIDEITRQALVENNGSTAIMAMPSKDYGDLLVYLSMNRNIKLPVMDIATLRESGEIRLGGGGQKIMASDEIYNYLFPGKDRTGIRIREEGAQYSLPATGQNLHPFSKNADDAYEKQKDIWIGTGDVRIHKSLVEKRNLQEELKNALAEPKFTPKVKDYDKAIQIYIDTKRNPAHIKQFGKNLTSEQKRILDLSQNLPENIKAIADKIEASYNEIGMEAKELDVIKNVLDNYAARVWDIKDKPSSEQLRKFGTKTRHAKERKFETILEGWNAGYNLKVEGATNNLQILKEEIVKTIEDKKFINSMKTLKDLDGNPLLTTKALDGYEKVIHPNFNTWKHAGTAEEGEVYGKNFFIDDEGNLFERRELYAPKDIAKNLNNILGISKLKGVPGIDFITKYNAIFKAWILQTSLFHHMAFMRSYYFGTNGKRWADMGIRDAYKNGIKSIMQESPLMELGIRNGLTLGLKQDWNEELLQEKTGIGKLIDKIPGGAPVKDKILKLRQMQADFLFGEFGAGLKAKSFIIEFKNLTKKHPELSADEVAKMAANLINDDFGGLHLRRMGRNPTLQHIFRLAALAPDWCVSEDTRAMTKTGWKYHSQLKIGIDEVLAFDPKTKKYQWSKLNDMYVNKNYNSDVITINNHNRKIIMTPEHKCYVYNNSKRKYEVVLAKNINTAHNIPTCAEFNYPESKVFSDEFIHLVGWVVTDGYFKKNKNELPNGESKTYYYAKIVQAKPAMVQHLKSLGLKYSIDTSMSEHDGIVSNYPKYTFNIPLELNELMLNENLNNGLSWEFLSKLTKLQLEILYDAMMLGDGTGQNRFCGKEKEVFFMTLLQTILGKASTFYKQEENCWRTRIVARENIGCENKNKEPYKGTIWCPSVDTGFWLAEKDGLVFITGNTESNVRTMVKMFKRGAQGEFYRRFWTGIITKGVGLTVLANYLLAAFDEDDRVNKGINERFLRNYRRAWQEGNLRWTGVDITPIYRGLGGKSQRRKYFSILGHFTDPLKFLTNIPRAAHHKGSVIYSLIYEYISGKDWAGRSFTNFNELLDEGKTVKWKFGGGFGVKYGQIPSYLLAQGVGLQPVQLQNLIGWMVGEQEGFDAIGNSMGLGVRTTYEKLPEKFTGRRAKPRPKSKRKARPRR